MLRTIQSNIEDQHFGADPFTEPALRSVTVFALGSPGRVTEPATLQRVRERAIELLGGEPEAEAVASFTGSGTEAISPGEPFGAIIAGHEAHQVRVIDGPLEDEAIAVVRVIGHHRWN